MSNSVSDTPFWQDYHESFPLGSPPENDVRSVAFDGRGRLWAATAAGVRFLDRNVWRAPGGADNLGEALTLFRDRAGTVWVGGVQGLARIDGERLVSEPLRPQLVCAITEDPTGTLYAAGPERIWIRRAGKPWEELKGRWHQAIRGIAPADHDHLWIATASGLYLQHTSSGKPSRRFGTPNQLLSSNLYCLTTLADGTVAVGSTGGVDLYRGTTRVRSLGVAQGLPNRHARQIAQDAEGRLWIATKLGVARYDFKSKTFSLRHSRRWLASDDAISVAISSDGTALVGTSSGVDAIRRKPMTLAEKAEHFGEIVRKRHIRTPGLVGPAVLKRAGDLSESFIEDDDNDGEHTAMYLAVESLRFAVTKDPKARQNAREAFNAMVVLQEVTGTPHFIARSVLPAGTAPIHEVDRTISPDERAKMQRDNPREKPIEKRWVPSTDGKWLWKRDASSDEIDGHLYGYATYFDLAADDAEKRRISALVDRIVGESSITGSCSRTSMAKRPSGETGRRRA